MGQKGQKRSRAVLVGLSAAAGVFAAAAMISAAVAPTARADDFSAVIADIQAEGTAAATAFSTSFTDLADGDTAAGLTQLFIGLDDDVVGVPDILDVGTVGVLTDTSVPNALASDFTPTATGGFGFDFATPTTVAESVTEAQTYYTDGTALATTIEGLPSTDYGLTQFDNAVSAIDQLILPDQIQLIADLAYGGF
jgi:hypothetical protein